MLNNRLGILEYLLLRNDIVWDHLSIEERDLILEANVVYNNRRHDYANPEMYGTDRVQGGEVFDSEADRLTFVRGKILKTTLDAYHPRSILEIGPGPGFYTRLLCESESVKEYTAIDIVPTFLEYLAPRLGNLVDQHKLDKYTLIEADFMQVEMASCDLIVLLSSLHHIPNRVDLFNKLVTLLNDGGHIICLDPSHYLARLWHLLRKYITRYHKREFWSDYRNLSTHSFCTYEEFVKISARVPQIVITDTYFELVRKARVFYNLDPDGFLKGTTSVYLKPNWLRWFSFQIGVVFETRGVGWHRHARS